MARSYIAGEQPSTRFPPAPSDRNDGVKAGVLARVSAVGHPAKSSSARLAKDNGVRFTVGSNTDTPPLGIFRSGMPGC